MGSVDHRALYSLRRPLPRDRLLPTPQQQIQISSCTISGRLFDSLIEEIARSSARLEALIFGPADYSASQGMDSKVIEGSLDTYPGDPWHYARNKIAIAARAAGIDAIDGAYPDFTNSEGYRRECIHSHVLGFVGKWAIHPSQINIANQIYAPTKEEVERARKLDAAYQEAQARGVGAVAIDGKMIDVAIIRSLRTTLQKADLLGM